MTFFEELQGSSETIIRSLLACTYEEKESGMVAAAALADLLAKHKVECEKFHPLSPPISILS